MNTPTPTISVTPKMSMEEFEQMRKELRRAKNREAAAESRRRVKLRLEELQSRLDKTEEENSHLRALASLLMQSVVEPTALSCAQQAEMAATLYSESFDDAYMDQYDYNAALPTSEHQLQHHQLQFGLQQQVPQMANCAVQSSSLLGDCADCEVLDEDLELLLL